MNEDRMIEILSNLDDDLLDKEIDNLMNGVDCDMDAINRKAHQKLEKYQRNKKATFWKRLSYVAAVGACFICLNVVYADEISKTLKSFFNQTPVYSTMVAGSAYYLEDRLVLDDDLAIDKFLVSEGRLDMDFTSKLGIEVLKDMKLVPKDAASTQYVMGGYSEEGDNKYSFSFMNGNENNYNIKPSNAFSLIVDGKTYSITLAQAKSLDGAQKLAESEATANKIDMVSVGANSSEKNGKLAVQLIAAFKDKDMKLAKFGEPVETTYKSTVENLGTAGIISTGTGSRTEAIYATDKNGVQYKLDVPADANAMPITTFVTDAPLDTELTVKLPALLATYQKTTDSFRVDIPQEGEKILNQDIDVFAQKAKATSIKRLSSTSAQLVLQLNTGAEKHVKIRSFNTYSQDVKKITSEFKGDTAILVLEFDQNIDTIKLDVSWPEFIMNGNWTINLK